MTTHIPIPSDRPVRVRIAPSPTGDPHVGTGYIGLFNQVFAHKHGGKFVLRIEDTDQVRSTAQSERAILESLAWLGLSWDEGPEKGGPYGPYRQSERKEIYQQHAKLLIERGHAYYCFATKEELEEMREVAKEKKLATSYDRRYRDLDPAQVRRRLDEGQPHVVRLKMPIGGETGFVDGLRGPISFDNAQIDDQILLKSDGMPTYHLANVVDDHLMEITHVIRAEEWISSTPKHVVLYEAFGWEAPTFIHMPLLRNTDKSKISKRKNPVSLRYYEDAGYLPEALLNYLGRMGWSMPDEAEKFTLDEMQAAFDFDRISLAGPVFDLDKLGWLNGLYIRELEHEDLVDRIMAWGLNRDRLLELAPMMRERINTFGDFVPMTAYFFGEDFEPDPDHLVPKKRERKETRKAIKAIAETVDGVVEWRAESIEGALKALMGELQWKPREFFPTVRWAVAGRKATPGLYEVMEAVGKARVQARLRRALTALKG